MQAVSTQFQVRHVSSALIGSFVTIVVVIALAAAVLIAVAPRSAASTSDATLQAWLDYRAGERADLVSPSAAQAAWNSYRAGERGDAAQP